MNADERSKDIVLSNEEVSVLDTKMKFYCRCIKINAFEYYPSVDRSSVKVILNKVGFFFYFKVQSPVTNNLFVCVKHSHIKHMDCHFSNRRSQYLFLHISDPGSEELVKAFNAAQVGHLLNKRKGRMVKVITFLLDESIPFQPANLQQYFPRLFPHLKINTEMTWEDVNEILTNPTKQSSTASPPTLNGAAPLELPCHKICIGSRKIIPTGRIPHVTLRLTSNSFTFSVSERRNVSLILKYRDVANLAAQFTEPLTIFIYTRMECAKNIRFQLAAIQGGPMCQASDYELEMDRRIAFFIKSLTEEEITAIRNILRFDQAPLQELHEAISTQWVFETFMQKPSMNQLQHSQNIKKKRSLSICSSTASSDIYSSDRSKCSKNENVPIITLDGEEDVNVSNGTTENNGVTNGKEGATLPKVGGILFDTQVPGNSIPKTENGVVCITIEDDDEDISFIGITPCKRQEEPNGDNVSNSNIGENKNDCHKSIICEKTQPETIKNPQQTLNASNDVHCTKNNFKGNARSNANLPETTVVNRAQVSTNNLENSVGGNVKGVSTAKNISSVNANNRNFVIKNKNDMYYIDISDASSDRAIRSENSITSDRIPVIVDPSLSAKNTPLAPGKSLALKLSSEKHVENIKAHENKSKIGELPQNSVNSSNVPFPRTQNVKSTDVPLVESKIVGNMSGENLPYLNKTSGKKVTETDPPEDICFSNIFDSVKMHKRSCCDLSDKNTVVTENKDSVSTNKEPLDIKFFENHLTKFPFLYSEVFYRKSLTDPSFSNIVYRAHKKSETVVYFESWCSCFKNDPSTVSTMIKKTRNNEQDCSGQATKQPVKRKIDPLVKSYCTRRRKKKKKVISTIGNQQSTSFDAQQNSVIKDVDNSVSSSKYEEPSISESSGNLSTSKDIKKTPSLKIILKRCNDGFKSSSNSSQGTFIIMNKETKGRDSSERTTSAKLGKRLRDSI